MVTEAKNIVNQHRGIKAFFQKYMADNIGMLAGYVSWTILTSIIPIAAGIVAISSFFFRTPSAKQSVVNHLSQALQGAISTQDLQNVVNVTTQHSGLLGIVGLLGVFWGGSNVGGAISTAFQAIFETSGRSFIQEKIIDIVMIFVFTALMLVILLSTSAGALLNQLFANVPIPGGAQFLIGTLISLLSGFLLFGAIYIAFPNIQPGLKMRNVWRGALLAAVLFQILSYIWPLYATFSHFQKYGSFLGAILVLTAWIYFFAMITMIGAEVIAISSIHQAKDEGESIGPPPEDGVPQHAVLRNERADNKQQKQAQEREKTTAAQTKQPAPRRAPVNAPQQQPTFMESTRRDPGFLILAATPLIVAMFAGLVEMVTGRRRPLV